MGCYLGRKDNFTYWNSKESLYWHFLRQLDVPHDVLRTIEVETELRSFLQGGEVDVVELGFGIGKTTEALIKSGLFKYRHLTALDTNRAICEYVEKHRSFPSCNFVCESVGELIKSKRNFDLLVVHGGG
jgi:16S rRNA A1518/A1519 N6-dimethyltransferase RsmA/KsgA/DIM1 with predicted DNA glycosylase/AP lyase activity